MKIDCSLHVFLGLLGPGPVDEKNGSRKTDCITLEFRIIK